MDVSDVCLCACSYVYMHICVDMEAISRCWVSSITLHLIFLTFIYFISICVQVLCPHAYHILAWCPKRSEEDVGPLELELEMVMSHHVSDSLN